MNSGVYYEAGLEIRDFINRVCEELNITPMQAVVAIKDLWEHRERPFLRPSTGTRPEVRRVAQNARERPRRAKENYSERWTRPVSRYISATGTTERHFPCVLTCQRPRVPGVYKNAREMPRSWRRVRGEV